MDNMNPEPVSYLVHEADMARMERANKRLWYTAIILILALVLSWGGFVWYESQFEDMTTTTYQADAEDGGNAIANGAGTVNVNGNS